MTVPDDAERTAASEPSVEPAAAAPESMALPVNDADVSEVPGTEVSAPISNSVARTDDLDGVDGSVEHTHRYGPLDMCLESGCARMKPPWLVAAEAEANSWNVRTPSGGRFGWFRDMPVPIRMMIFLGLLAVSFSAAGNIVTGSLSNPPEGRFPQVVYVDPPVLSEPTDVAPGPDGAVPSAEPSPEPSPTVGFRN